MPLDSSHPKTPPPTLNISHIGRYSHATENPISPERRDYRLCRLCHKAIEDSIHMGQCKIIQSLFSRINRLNATPTRMCSALRRGGAPDKAVVEILFLAPREDVPLAIGSLLTILWEYTPISWYQIDIDHKAFIKDTVWGQSIRRFALRGVVPSPTSQI
eukprot:scaffold276_cov116-Isochrysis_galbana.AAC.6